MSLCKKKKFTTELEAKQFNSGFTPYWCKVCECWHLTSNGGYKVFQAAGHPADALLWMRRHTRSKKKRGKNRSDELEIE